METIATKMYGAAGVEYDRKALASIEQIEKLGLGNLPVCVAKTPASLSDVPELRGVPKDFTIRVNEVRLSAGAGLIVMLCGSIVTHAGPAARVGCGADAGRFRRPDRPLSPSR